MSDHQPQWLIIHSTDRRSIEKAREEATRIFYRAELINGEPKRIVEVTEGVRTPLNVYCWFVVGPCGARTGYPELEEHYHRLDEMSKWLSEYRVDDGVGGGYNPLHWVIVEHAEEGDEHTIQDEGREFSDE